MAAAEKEIDELRDHNRQLEDKAKGLPEEK
jgi:hypothetical protein